MGWYGENKPGRGDWQIAGEAIRPEQLKLSTLVVVPGADRIVPPRTATALADRIERAERLDPHSGHIGMVVGSGSERTMWEPVRTWIERQASVSRPRRHGRMRRA
jgi:polyhydroxyalkanoate synthase